VASLLMGGEASNKPSALKRLTKRPRDSPRG
jgi:hypothetical protein